jgi:hypothetical protein
MDPALEEKLQSMFSQWEGERPGATDVSAPPIPGAAPDYAQPPMDDSPPPLRLRPPPESPATSMPANPTTAGVGQGPLSPSPQAAVPGQPAASLDVPRGTAPDWQQLGDNLKRAESNAGSSRDAEHLFANIAAGWGIGHHERTDYGGDVAEAKAPLELAQARQQFEGNETKSKALAAQAGVKAAENDPNSLQSQKAREALKSMFAGSAVKLPNIDSWSAADIGKFAKTGDLAHLEQSRAASAAKATEDAARATAADEKAAAATKELEGSRKAYAKELKGLGIDPTTASQKDIDRAISVGHNKATEQVAKATLAIAGAQEGRHKNDTEALNQGIPFAGTTLKYTGTGTPRPDDVDKAQTVASLYGSAIEGMDDLDKSISEFAAHPSPATKDDVASRARIVSGHLNTAMGQGAMSIDEARAMSQVLGSDMTSTAGVQALVDKMTGDDPAAAAALARKLKAARESTRASAIGKLRAYRFGVPVETKKGSDGQTYRKNENGKWEPAGG